MNAENADFLGHWQDCNAVGRVGNPTYVFWAKEIMGL